MTIIEIIIKTVRDNTGFLSESVIQEKVSSLAQEFYDAGKAEGMKRAGDIFQLDMEEFKDHFKKQITKELELL